MDVHIEDYVGNKKVLVHRDPWRGMPITKRIGGLREGRQCYAAG